METNLLKQLDIVEGDTRYPVYIYDEGAHNKIGALGDLTTEDKSNIVSAVNELVTKDSTLNSKIDGAVSRIDGDISNLDTDLQSFKTQTGNNLTTLSNKIGELSNLDTETKTNLVSAINEVLNDVQTLDPDLMHYVYVEKYLDLGQNATTALRNAIADCPAKGVVVCPMETLTITETIVIDKPLKLMGLRNGFYQTEGGNDFTPNSDYITADLIMKGLSTCIQVGSPSVEISELNIFIDSSVDCKVFELKSVAGDNLQMPRDIRMSHVNVINTDYPTGTMPHVLYGVYSDEPVLLSKFEHVTFGWLSYGFYFNANINTSISLYDCNLSVSEIGYYFKNTTYSHLIRCGCESGNHTGFRFDGCKSITVLDCFCEQIQGDDFYANACQAINFIGCFATSGILVKTSLSSGTIIGCTCSYASTNILPWFSLYGSYMDLSGISDCFITVDGGATTQRIGYSNKVCKGTSTDFSSFSASGCSIIGGVWSVTDTTINIAMEINATASAGTITMPAYILPIHGYWFTMTPQGWATLAYSSNVITFNFGSTGTFRLEMQFESIASQ